MFAFARQGRNVLDARVTPVIFLPGIMGSRLSLRDDDGNKTDKVNWDPDAPIAMGFNWLNASAEDKARRLDADNPGSVLESGNGLSDDRCKRGWAGVVAEFYLDILEALESGLKSDMFKCPVYAFGYDWRQPNKITGDQLKDYVDEVLAEVNASTAVLVTHSMGGIVARAALRDGKFQKNKIAGVVHIGQPVLGAPSAYRRLLEGMNEDLDGSLARLLRDKPETVAVFSAVPSVFELLPSDARSIPSKAAHEEWMAFRTPDKPDELHTFPDPKTIAVYMYNDSPPGVAEDGPLRETIRTRTRKGAKFTRDLGTTMHSFTAAIYGDDVETDTRAIFSLTEEGIKGASYDVLDGRSSEGDGTVPTWSGQALFPGQAHETREPVDPEVQSQWVVRGVAHDAMCNSSEVQHATIQFIHALLHPPRLARTRIGSDGAVALRTIKAALGGDRSAEMEIRVAKLLVQEGETVTLAENPDTEKTPDLHTSQGDADVKFSTGGTIKRLRQLIRSGLGQIGDNGRVLLVRSSSSDIAPSNYLEVLEEEFVRAFGVDFRSRVTARYRLIREAELPPLWEPPPSE